MTGMYRDPSPSPPLPNTPSFVPSLSTLFVQMALSVFVGALNAILIPSPPPLHAPLPRACFLASFLTHSSSLLRRCGGSHFRSSIHHTGFFTITLSFSRGHNLKGLPLWHGHKDSTSMCVEYYGQPDQSHDKCPSAGR